MSEILDEFGGRLIEVQPRARGRFAEIITPITYLTDTCEKCRAEVGEQNLIACGEQMVCPACWTIHK